MKNLKFCLLCLFILISSLTFADCTAIANGNWSDPATWSCGRAPADGDIITIPAGFTVTVDINTPSYGNMVINVEGELTFENGQKINMECDGVVNVSETGQLTGGNPGSKINICGEPVWNGPGPDAGPIRLQAAPLPIELLSFTAEIANETFVELRWITATETNNDFFTLERSANGVTYEKVKVVDGSGNSSGIKEYSAMDNTPFEGTSYYKLKQTDFNGQFTYFSPIAVEYSKSGTGCILTVYPNPCSSECKIDLSGCDDQTSPEINVELLDAAGNKVFSKIPVRDDKGSFSFTVDSNNNLKPGVYVVRGTSKRENYSKKMIVK
jgi:hypothetical protein